jgi:pimeloyl-ACP methyl ester carboxylesterase
LENSTLKKVSGEIQVGRFLIPYRVYGEAGRILVCISGAKQTMSAWKSVIAYFHQQYRVVVFDLPGQGRAKILSGGPRIEMEEQLAVVHALVEQVGVHQSEQNIIAGASWGAVLAAAYCERFPEHFDQAVLGSFGTKANPVLSAVIEQVQALIDAGRAKDIAPMMIEKFGQYIPDTLKKQILLQFDNMSEEQFRAFYEHSLLVTEMEDLNRYLDLTRIRTNTLVIMGQYDTIMDLFETKKAAAKIPNSQYYVHKGVGHFLHWEDDEVLRVYEEFFENGIVKK